MPKKTRSKLEGSDFTESEVVKKKDINHKVYQRDKINYDLHIRVRDDLTEKQKRYLEIILDKKTKVVFLSGVAGVSKTYLALMAALTLLNNKRVGEIHYVRSIAESASKSLGSLPGGVGDKITPFLMPLMDKLEELIPRSEVDRLIKDERIHGTPINYLRGASMNATCALLDEAQNTTLKELTTFITRMGEYSKFILLGDPMQSDINGHSGFKAMFDLFNDKESRDQGIVCLEFGKEDIVRSGILKFIIEKLENDQKPDGTWRPREK